MRVLSCFFAFWAICMCGSAIIQGLHAQAPEIKWWFDTKDAAFGQTAAADIDHDGYLELVFGCYRNDSSVYALNAENGSKAWEIAVDLNSWIQTAPTIVDLDGDQLPDFVVATWNSVSGDTNKVFAYRGYDRQLL